MKDSVFNNTILKDTILIVDNDESILKCLDLMLNEEFNIITAASGNEALKILKSQRVECIISDYEMSDGNGLTLLNQLDKKDVPFILITGLGEKNLFKEFANKKAFHIFEKPINTNIIVVVRDAVANYHRYQKQFRDSLIGKQTSNIIHDLNNGLAIIEGSAQIALNKTTLEYPKFFSLSLKACKQIASMVTKYKAFTNNEENIQLSGLELNSFFKELLEELVLSHGESVSFKTTSQSLDNLVISADADFLRQVLLNLVSNSLHEIRHTPNPAIHFELMKTNTYTTINVIDSGSISDEVARNLFKEQFSTKKENGTGMGLYYCRNLL